MTDTSQPPVPHNESAAGGSIEPLAASVPAPVPFDLEGLTRRDALLDVGILLTVLLVPRAPRLLELALGLRVPGVPANSVEVFTRWCGAALFVAFLTYFTLRHRLSAASFGVRTDCLASQVSWGAIAFVADCIWEYGVGSTLRGWLSSTLPELIAEDARGGRNSHMPSSALFLLLWWLPGAIWEETAYRGLMLPYLRRVLGGWGGAVAISAVLFGIGHLPQGVVHAFMAAGAGVIYAIVFIRSRSLLAVIIAHATFNFWLFYRPA
jgi:membrane protease YdiL (CAAX protease family)